MWFSATMLKDNWKIKSRNNLENNITMKQDLKKNTIFYSYPSLVFLTIYKHVGDNGSFK